MSQEQRELAPWQVEYLARNELLMAAASEETERVEPCGDRIPFAVSQFVRSRQPQGCAPRGGVLVANCSHTEVPGRVRDYPQVLLIATGVADRLPPDERTVADQVGEHDQLWLRHLLSLRGFWRRPRYRNPGANGEFSERLPALSCQKGMVGRCRDFTARSQS